MYFVFKRYILKQMKSLIEAYFTALKEQRLRAIDMEGVQLKVPDKLIISTIDKWSPREVPAIVLDVEGVDFDFGSIDKGFALQERQENESAKDVFVYNSKISFNCNCYSFVLEERDSLVDLILFFLTRYDIYEFLRTRRILLSEPARVRTFGEEMAPGQDFKIYYGSINIGFLADNVITEIRDVPTIADVIAEVEDPIKFDV